MYVNTDYKTYYGNISSHWKIDNNKLFLDIEIPVNTKATIYIPATNVESVKESDQPLSSAKDIQVKGKEGDYLVAEVGSGAYHFSVEK